MKKMFHHLQGNIALITLFSVLLFFTSPLPVAYSNTDSLTLDIPLPAGISDPEETGISDAFPFPENTTTTQKFETSLNTTLKYDAAWRIEDPDPNLPTEGNMNFEKGDLITNRISALFEVDFQYDNKGLFLRPRAFFDFVYDDDIFSSPTQDTHRDKIELLDGYLYGELDLQGRFLTLRAGRQVVSWGESLFIPNSISSAQSAVDTTIATSPDVELKDLYLPNGQLFMKLELGKGWSMAANYHFEWEKNRLMERGSYWSFNDMFDEAGGDVPVPVMEGIVPEFDKAGSREASEQGQWGVALRYYSDALNGTEFGFYFLNYHDKSPMFLFHPLTGGTPDVDPVLYANSTVIDSQGTTLGQKLALIDTSSYQLAYQEDIKLYGFSVSSVIGKWNVSGEMSFRQDLAVRVMDTHNSMNLLGFSYEEANMLQTQVSFSRIFGNSLIWQELTLLGETGFTKVYETGDAKLYDDDFAWGAVIQLEPVYYRIYPGLDLAVPVTFHLNPQGTAGPFSENSDQLGIRFDFTYKSKYEFGIGYTAFPGGSDDNHYSDRQNVSFSFKYVF